MIFRVNRRLFKCEPLKAAFALVLDWVIQRKLQLIQSLVFLVLLPDVSYQPRHRQLRRIANQHVDLVRHDVALFDPAVFLLGKAVKRFSKFPPRHSEEFLAPVFRNVYDMVFALPLPVTQTLVIFHGVPLEVVALVGSKTQTPRKTVRQIIL